MSEPPRSAGPPPMPEVSDGAVSPPPKAAAHVTIEQAESLTDKLVGEVPTALAFFLVALGVTLLCTLVVPKSVVIALPITAMIGFWPASYGWRIRASLPFGNPFSRMLSPMGKYSSWLVFLGLSPIALGLVGMLFLSNASNSDGDILMRLLVVAFSIVVIPATIYLRGKAVRHTGKPASINRRWVVLAAGVVVLISSAISAASFFIFERRESPEDWYASYQSEIDATKQQVEQAHELWDDNNRKQAVKAYKSILRDENRSYMSDEIPVLYRRVIEFEAELGDASEARDWCMRAVQETATEVRLTFESPIATEIWNEVVQAEGTR